MSIFRFFSLYTDAFEKRIDRFFSRLDHRSSSDLLELIQTDLARLTLFLEYRFKGYKKLKRRYRKKLYQNADLLKQDFLTFVKVNESRLPEFKSALRLPDHLQADLHFDFLILIMRYLKPGRILSYQESVSFERLLRDPSDEKLVGDCNQICTLYIYLFSLRYSVSELQVKLLEDHICLHYRGQDIETTSGEPTHYKDYLFLSDVTEIVSTNILDIHEPGESRFDLSPKNMMEAARLAYKFSNHRSTVERNLLIAYQNLAAFYAKKKSFKQAVLYADKSGSTILQRDVRRMEAVYFFRLKKYKLALQKFKKINDLEGQKACYSAQLSDLLKVVKPLKTLDQFKSKKFTLRKVRVLALELGDKKIIQFVDDVLRKI